jgi:predicted lipoprotein with Yx(FWY)xxD motif
LEVIMTILSGRHWSRAAAAAASLGLVAATLVFSAPASAQTVSAPSDIACSSAVTGAPTGPAIVSATSTPYGRVLVEGSADYAGCSLYVLTSDELRALSGADFACSDNSNALGAPCDAVLWPALLTEGAPIAGPGVNPTLLGTVTRTDFPFLGPGESVQQVTYAGLPLYRFLFDEGPGETEGANLFDPVTSPPGTWFLVDPSRGLPAQGQATLQVESVGGTDVLAATMNNDFSVFPNAIFPVYTLSSDGGHASACEGQCALIWQPVLTSMRPQAGPGVDQHALGIIVRPDGTHQVTYDGQPLYLFYRDAYIANLPGDPYGTARIDGDGASTPWGTFQAVPLS